MSRFAQLFGRFSARRPLPPWLALHAGEGALLGALAIAGSEPRPAVQLMPPAPISERADTLRSWRESIGKPVRANAVLRSSEYRVLPIEPPDLPDNELREAARWQIADALDFPVEQASIDLLNLPTASGGVARQRFAVAAPHEHVTRWLQQCREAALPLHSIEIPEMAMRNLSVLAAGDSAHAFLHIGLRSTRLALIWKRELCSFRHLEVSATQFAERDGEGRTALHERLALDVQRTVDAFARQFSGIDLETLWLSSLFEPEAGAEALGLQLAQRVRHFVLDDHVQVNGPVPALDLSRSLDHLLVIGAALRTDSEPHELH